MIEVTAKLPHGHVFLSGEVVECSIIFSHPPSPTHKVSQSHRDVFESLAWASAQIHCQCFTDSKICKDNDQVNQLTFAHTALGTVTSENGKIEIATKPKILFCDLRLSPGQTKTFIYREKIPNDSPPSYRGQLIKYSYKITIGTQRVNSPIKLLRVPIRVLPLCEAFLSEVVALCNETTEELTPANPFLEMRQKEKPLDLALQSLQNITARRNPNFYMITNMWGKVARFCLFKPAYKLGEDIVGTFDFTVATVSCMQVSVSLQCEEETLIDINQENSKQVRIITFSKHHEVCLGYKYTQLILPIPLHVTPEFKTKLVSLKWRLHFEFVTSTHKGLASPSGEDADWRAPLEVPIETMVWSLPIRLYSSTPIHVAQGIQTNTSHKLCIRTNFISKIAFWIMKYLIPSFSNYVCIFVARQNKVVLRILNELFEIHKIVQNKFKMSSRQILVGIYISMLFFCLITLVILDCYYNNYNFFSIWSLYVPSIIVNIYIAVNVFLIETCVIYFKILNEYIEEFSNCRLIDTVIHIQTTNCYNTQNNTSNLFCNFVTYDKIYKVICNINKLGGSVIALYWVIGITISLSVTFSYITCEIVNSVNSSYNMNFSREYCSVTFLAGMMLVINVSHHLQMETKRTGFITYKLVNLYSNVKDEIIFYGLQTFNQKVQITANGLFIIDCDIIPEIILLFIIYLSVFVQIDDY